MNLASAGIGGTLAVLLFSACIGFLYFLPAFVAARANKRNFGAIVVLNLFLGWTFVGWVVALVWALVEDRFPDP